MVLARWGENQEQIGPIRECVLIRQRGRQVLTVLRNAHNHLQLFSWRVNAQGAVVRIGESGVQPETITQLAVAHASKFVVAGRTASRHLKLISWDVGNTGAIYRAGESQEQSTPIAKVKIVALGQTLLLTAAITSAGQVQLTSWQLDRQADLLPLAQVTTTEAVRELALVPLPSPEQTPWVLTVTRTRQGEICLQTWQTTPTGEITSLGQQIAPGQSGTQLQAVVNEQGLVITSLRTATGHLRLSTWAISADGCALTLLADTGDRGEAIRHQALMQLPGGVVTALSLPGGRVQLQAWTINPAGQIARSYSGDKTVLPGHHLTLCPEALDGNAPILTSLHTARGGLRLITWQG
jgi:hypothetical protein